ncbi:hypothetical protein LOAG_00755 [Loa loa]|uniref:Uncharacterized protein n=1 Tax=Loa loa TaxID=7209 RepID=A0A1S0UAP0_LOALO|nr:hypothetical protein LOAG_00755 [Loa loa]EFO27724.2 hypothetical protein LOAG_00755 [Loa loa]
MNEWINELVLCGKCKQKISLSFTKLIKIDIQSGISDSGTSKKRKEMAANGVHKSDDCLEEKGEEEEERGREVRSSSSSSSELGNTYSLSLNNKILCHIFGTVAGSHSLFTE